MDRSEVEKPCQRDVAVVLDDLFLGLDNLEDVQYFQEFEVLQGGSRAGLDGLVDVEEGRRSYSFVRAILFLEAFESAAHGGAMLELEKSGHGVRVLSKLGVLHDLV